MVSELFYMLWGYRCSFGCSPYMILLGEETRLTQWALIKQLLNTYCVLVTVLEQKQWPAPASTDFTLSWDWQEIKWKICNKVWWIFLSAVKYKKKGAWLEHAIQEKSSWEGQKEEEGRQGPMLQRLEEQTMGGHTSSEASAEIEA